MTRHTITIDDQLSRSIDDILLEREVSLSQVVSLYLRSMVNSVEQGKALRLDSRMPFGKYRGEEVSTIAAADPGYLRYLLGGDKPVQFEPEVLEKLK